MKKIFTGFLVMTICISGFMSCTSDDVLENEKLSRSYELTKIKWKLDKNDGQTIIEEPLPGLYFRNESDTIMPVVIEPLKDLKGSSKFTFNDPVTFNKLHFSEVQVSIPNEIELLSENYSYLMGGQKVFLGLEEATFPFSWNIKDSISLNQKSELNYNCTVFLKQNKASFVAVFRETNTRETIELDGTWTGIFFNNLTDISVIKSIE